jgi:hypoxia up-regulated 1
MSLQHVRKIAKDDGNGDVRDAVITVPAWFTQKERQAVLDAAELAGLSVMSLINDNAAVAVTYGIDRVYAPNVTHTALFFDMGSAGIETSVVEYSAARATGYGKTLRHSGQAVVKATATAPTLGGLALDAVLRDLLIEEFERKHGAKAAGVRSSPRAMAKLLKQANTVKTVLSANNEIPVRVESVFNDLDLVTVVSRDQFYDRAVPLLRGLAEPVARVLAAAGMQPDQLDAVVVVGGSVRVPAVQTLLKEALARDSLAQNVNGDEAMAMGAVFRAANVSTVFQVRQFGLSDASSQAVSVAMEGEGLSKQLELFAIHHPLGRKKVVTVAHNGDMVVRLSHPRASVAEGTPAQLATYRVSGVAAVLADERWASLLDDGKAKLALAFTLTDSGIVVLSGADAVFEVPEEQPAPDANGTVAAPKTKKTKVALTVTQLEDGDDDQHHRTDTGFVALTAAAKEASAARLQELTANDLARRALAAARNSLEAHVYAVRAELYEDAFEAVTTEEERGQLRAASEAAEEWLYSADEATLEDYAAELARLNEGFEPAMYRKKQVGARAAAFATVEQAVEQARKQVSNWAKHKPWLAEQSAGVEELAEDIEKAVAAMAEEQAQTAPHAAPVFDAEAVVAKLKPLTALIGRLDRIKKPQPPKKEANKTAAEQPGEPQPAGGAGEPAGAAAEEAKEPVKEADADAKPEDKADQADKEVKSEKDEL